MKLNLGIRRRLAPLVDDDRRRIELLNALLFSLPGAPIVYYGDEIGMGDNIYLYDRNGVRTPMQWNMDRNAGFSRADAARLYAPVIADPLFGYLSVNVEAQERSSSSLLHWIKDLIKLRKSLPVLGLGDLSFIACDNLKVLAFVRSWENEHILCVNNLSQSAQAADLDLRAYAGQTPVDVFGGASFPPIDEQPYRVMLGPYGYYWLRLAQQ
jgi:maltose alpha-D-glucosyltransferase/alpha-amylase